MCGNTLETDISTPSYHPTNCSITSSPPQAVDNVVVINPGPLSKPKSSGTYARMMIFPYELSAEERQEPDTHLTHRVYDRARVDIIRI